jgi:hypothetical protein
MASKGDKKVQVEFLGKAADKLEKLEEATGLDASGVVSQAVSAFSSLTQLADTDGVVTIIGPNGKRYTINIEVKYKK